MFPCRKHRVTLATINPDLNTDTTAINHARSLLSTWTARPPLSRSAMLPLLPVVKVGYVRSLFAHCRMALMAAPSAAGRPVKASVIDAFRLRCLRIQRDAGLSEANAIYVLDLTIDPLLGALFAPGIPVPVQFLVARLHDRAVHIVPDECDEYPDVYETPSGVPAPDDAEVAITLRLGVILAGVIADLKTRQPAGGTGPSPARTCSPRHAPVSAGTSHIEAGLSRHGALVT